MEGVYDDSYSHSYDCSYNYDEMVKEYTYTSTVFERDVLVRNVFPTKTRRHGRKREDWWYSPRGPGYSCRECYLNYVCFEHRNEVPFYDKKYYTSVHIPELPRDLLRLIIETAISGKYCTSVSMRLALYFFRRVNRAWRDLVDSTSYFREVVIPRRFTFDLVRCGEVASIIKVYGKYHSIRKAVVDQGLRIDDYYGDHIWKSFQSKQYRLSTWFFSLDELETEVNKMERCLQTYVRLP